MRIPEFLRNYLFAKALATMASRPPDLAIQPEGRELYLERWWWLNTRPLSIYVHNIHRSDADTLHDHRGPNISILLLGSYDEHTIAAGGVHHRARRYACDVVFRMARAAHRLELRQLGPDRYRIVTTIWIVGPKWRNWGFHTRGGWVPNEQFIETQGKVSVRRV